MNQLPISLTLYYPTAAQFENCLGFMAMLSIACSTVYLTLPLWLWPLKQTALHGSKSAWPVLFMSANPIGTAAMIIARSAFGLRMAGIEGWSFYIIPSLLIIPIFSATA